MSESNEALLEEKKMLNDNLIEEWKKLRDEVARKQIFVERLVVITVSGNLAIFSFASSLQRIDPVNAFIALLSILLTTISYFWILRNLLSGFRIAKYIKEYIEPKTGLNWETWLGVSRRGTQQEGKIKMRADFFSIFYHSLFIISLLECIVLIWAAHWPYRIPSIQAVTVSNQVHQVPADICVLLTLAALIFWGIWYFVARVLFVDPTTRDIRNLLHGIERMEA